MLRCSIWNASSTSDPYLALTARYNENDVRVVMVAAAGRRGVEAEEGVGGGGEEGGGVRVEVRSGVGVGVGGYGWGREGGWGLEHG